MYPDDSQQAEPLKTRRIGNAARWLFLLLMLMLVICRLLSIHTEAINWDEFALFNRVDKTIDTGRLAGGGRPGLSVLALIPWVKDCVDAVRTISSARYLWTLWTIGLVAGLFFLVREFLRPTDSAWRGAALAVGMLVLVPVFLRWSIQVRTDQLAVLGGLWGGVALLRSRQHWPWALGAGALLACGYLSSQKLLYVAGLVGLVAAGDLFVNRTFNWKREALRAGALAVGGSVVLALWWLLLPLFIDHTRLHSLTAALDVFAWYRATFGYRTYHAMLPSLVPHGLVLASLPVLSILVWRRHLPGGRLLVVAWAVVALGLAVGLFHAAAFPYFWITLGLFPAVASATVWPVLLGSVRTARPRLLLSIGVWVVLIGGTIPTVMDMLIDTQATQLASLSFIKRNFRPRDTGFESYGVLFCRASPDPMPTYMGDLVEHAFFKEGAEKIRGFIDSFSRRQVKFIIVSHQMSDYPTQIKRFWLANYVPYRHQVFVAGKALRGSADAPSRFRLIIDGRYRWIPAKYHAAPVEIDGKPLRAGDVAWLARGRHLARFRGKHRGMLVLALEEPPRPSRELFFSYQQLSDVTGR